MSPPVKISTPPPSVEETAQLIGVPRERVRELVQIARGETFIRSSARKRRSVAARKAARQRGPAKGAKK